MHLPSLDIFIGLAFIVGIAYGFLLKRDKTITTLCSVYVGLVIASSFSETVYKFFNGNTTIANQIWVRSNASVSTISIILFLASILFISGAINSTTNRSSDISALEVIIFSACTIAIIISSILYFLPPEVSQQYLATSKMATLLLNYRIFLIVGAPLSIIILNFRKK